MLPATLPPLTSRRRITRYPRLERILRDEDISYAALSRSSGIDSRLLSNTQLGRRYNLSSAQKRRLADLLGVPVDDLFGDDRFAS